MTEAVFMHDEASPVPRRGAARRLALLSALLVSGMGCGVALAQGTAPAPAPAQDATVSPVGEHPPLTPTRDVQVDYDVQPDGMPEPKRVRTWFAQNGGLMRIDSPQGMGETILNRMTRQVTIIINTQKIYSQLDARYGISNPFLLDLTMSFSRKGASSVAGGACTEWDVRTDQGTAVACVTEDGVILREVGVDGDGLKGRIEAVHVTYGPIALDMFQPPANYRRIDPPPPPGTPKGGEKK